MRRPRRRGAGGGRGTRRLFSGGVGGTGRHPSECVRAV
ncbi:hypothetical protein KCH_19600 [Kitasatospora cheerisanensis KCTC 2395]|uniref:Uncharacterized protein n=1 Tax=Kitasatospora cheerisanensis KCTC 2395 TaxID=1348663 RepID=A0A066YX79_9ACTN|nr:hypothetical protein KCH_19600 [Kitasatospora cheerisanensis KCTC 2395]